MSTVNPFKVTLRKKRKGWKKWIHYPVLAIDFNTYETQIKPIELTDKERNGLDEDEIEDIEKEREKNMQYQQQTELWYLLGNSENGKMEWFNAVETKFVE